MEKSQEKILKYLKKRERKEGSPVNVSIRTISDETGVSETTVRNKLYLMHTNKIIKRDTTKHNNPKIFVL